MISKFHILLSIALFSIIPALNLHGADQAEELDWWSWKPLHLPAIPEANPEDRHWVRTPIDAFILAKLREKGLTYSSEADRRTLIRRLYFDLVGLPPPPEEVEAFVHDPDTLAYEKLVDRLLASPHYGERWGRHWLDVVKYGDTCGYDKDKLRPNAWPYRDYVIRSLNEDKPYARLVQEQIAGDVLFPNTPDGILGLGFIAAGPWDFIGHVEVPESKIDGKIARHIDRDEMLTNTLNTFCSVTIQCARCHDHKFDPVTQEHYYGMQTIFAAVDRAERVYDVDPIVQRKRTELKRKLAALQKDRATLTETIRQEGGEELAQLEERIRELEPKAKLKAKRPEFGYHSQIAPQSDVEKWVQIDLGKEVSLSKIVLRPCHDDFAGIGAGFGFPPRFKVTIGSEGTPSTVVIDQTKDDYPNPGLAPFEIDVTGATARLIRVTATKLAERQNDFIFALAEMQVFDEAGREIGVGAEVTALDSIEAPVRWRKSNLTDGIWAKPQDEQAAGTFARAKQQHQGILARLHTPKRRAQLDQLEREIGTTQAALEALPVGKKVYAAATEFEPQGNFKPTQGTPREIHVLKRGNILTPGEVAVPGTIPLIPGVPTKLNLPPNHSEGDRRATLARWITRKDHPLTWRSIVNRVWQYHFGQGIVETPNDFGRMGQRPTHPKLLDWLAVEFRDQGQSLKHLHRLIVTSSVYRQSSAHHANNAAIDGGNRYLWRMNRRRLEAEEIRDSILTVSGRLDRKMGGPGYYLFVLEKTEHSPHYEYHKFDPRDPDSHRRAVYRFVVRSQPDPYMTILDCADSSQSTPKRNETLTSLQALSMLNNDFNLAMAEYFADRLTKEADTLDDQVDLAIWLIAGRAPTRVERERLRKYVHEHGLANMCRVLFNLSEFVFVE